MQRSAQSARTAAAPSPATKLYSIAGLLRGREFKGKFQARGVKYQFAFAPASATISGGKLEFTGSLSVSTTHGRKRQADDVRATLAATQGGIGTAPVRKQSAELVSSDLPATESSGPLSFVGVMYLRLSPLEGRALGIPIDVSSVQLNARLAPTSELERQLQWLFSAAVEAIYGERPNERAAAEYIEEINRWLKA